MSEAHASPHEPHPWRDKTPDEVLKTLVYELYGPVSALGQEVDRLSTGAFEDEELTALLAQIAGGVNALSRLVVILKRYTLERQEILALAAEPAAQPAAPDQPNT